MSLSMHDASVAVFSRCLRQLGALVDIARRHAARSGIDPRTLLDARLAPSMFPFALQVDIAAQFSLRACAPLAQLDVPDFGEPSRSFDDLAARIERSLAFLSGIDPWHMEGAETRTCTSRAGEALVSLPGREFLLQYAMPNFFFHMTTAYAILRQQGVPVGKGNFDGFHVYPARD